MRSKPTPTFFLKILSLLSTIYLCMAPSVASAVVILPPSVPHDASARWAVDFCLHHGAPQQKIPGCEQLDLPSKEGRTLTPELVSRATDAIYRKDFATAETLLQEVAALGAYEGLVKLGGWYEDGRFGEHRLVSARRLYEQAANQGAPGAAFRYAELTYNFSLEPREATMAWISERATKDLHLSMLFRRIRAFGPPDARVAADPLLLGEDSSLSRLVLGSRDHTIWLLKPGTNSVNESRKLLEKKASSVNEGPSAWLAASMGPLASGEATNTVRQREIAKTLSFSSLPSWRDMPSPELAALAITGLGELYQPTGLFLTEPVRVSVSKESGQWYLRLAAVDEVRRIPLIIPGTSNADGKDLYESAVGCLGDHGYFGAGFTATLRSSIARRGRPVYCSSSPTSLRMEKSVGLASPMGLLTWASWLSEIDTLQAARYWYMAYLRAREAAAICMTPGAARLYFETDVFPALRSRLASQSSELLEKAMSEAVEISRQVGVTYDKEICDMVTAGQQLDGLTLKSRQKPVSTWSPILERTRRSFLAKGAQYWLDSAALTYQ